MARNTRCLAYIHNNNTLNVTRSKQRYSIMIFATQTITLHHVLAIAILHFVYIASNISSSENESTEGTAGTTNILPTIDKDINPESKDLSSQLLFYEMLRNEVSRGQRKEVFQAPEARSLGLRGGNGDLTDTFDRKRTRDRRNRSSVNVHRCSWNRDP
ncbi:hypothetical protein KQX54_001774 [Cotesia glomerata]|uniref:Uncharacterized protein n=1 Tax=Cotesia glomerata TaxID=32391 RepID=A0AAV7IEZ4_COTGL|nr:hypothetical protein KQX54_001774 [Cotesia glomerata]